MADWRAGKARLRESIDIKIAGAVAQKNERRSGETGVGGGGGGSKSGRNRKRLSLASVRKGIDANNLRVREMHASVVAAAVRY